MKRLGGEVLAMENAWEFSSAAKGESRDPPSCRRTGGPPKRYRPRSWNNSLPRSLASIEANWTTASTTTAQDFVYARFIGKEVQQQERRCRWKGDTWCGGRRRGRERELLSDSHHVEEPKKFLRENMRERERGWKKEEKNGGQENLPTDHPCPLLPPCNDRSEKKRRPKSRREGKTDMREKRIAKSNR